MCSCLFVCMCVLHGLWVGCVHSELKGTPTRREYIPLKVLVVRIAPTRSGLEV